VKSSVIVDPLKVMIPFRSRPSTTVPRKFEGLFLRRPAVEPVGKRPCAVLLDEARAKSADPGILAQARLISMLPAAAWVSHTPTRA